MHENAYDVCMTTPSRVQYTIRAIPRSVDLRLRRVAKESGKSLNQVALEALSRGVGLTEADEEPIARRNVDYLVGSWRPEPDVLDAFAAMRTVDPKSWR